MDQIKDEIADLLADKVETCCNDGIKSFKLTKQLQKARKEYRKRQRNADFPYDYMVKSAAERWPVIADLRHMQATLRDDPESPYGGHEITPLPGERLAFGFELLGNADDD